jgi:hypothetical protein
MKEEGGEIVITQYYTETKWLAKTVADSIGADKETSMK